MIKLYSYPRLFAVADNNPFGLKVYAFLRLAGLAFEHEHIFDASKAPRGQLPYIVDDGETIGDSEAIVAHLIRKYRLALDADLTQAERDTGHLVRRMLDGLYWTMSYSRWKDEEYWPLFRDAILREHPQVTAEAMEGARKYNAERYYYQGIGRYEPAQVYEKGLADLRVIANLVADRDFLFGATPSSTDAALYGFLANIHFHDIETPLKRFTAGHERLARYVERMHGRVAA